MFKSNTKKSDIIVPNVNIRPNPRITLKFTYRQSMNKKVSNAPIVNIRQQPSKTIKVHFSSRHGASRYNCTECEHSLSSNQMLTKHIQVEHQKISIIVPIVSTRQNPSQTLRFTYRQSMKV